MMHGEYPFSIFSIGAHCRCIFSTIHFNITQCHPAILIFLCAPKRYYSLGNQCETNVPNVIYTCHVHIPIIYKYDSMIVPIYKQTYIYTYIYKIHMYIYIYLFRSLEMLLFCQKSSTILAHTSTAPYAALSLNSGIPGQSIHPNGWWEV